MKLFRTVLIIINLIMSVVNVWFFCISHHWQNAAGAVGGVAVAGLLYVTGKVVGEY